MSQNAAMSSAPPAASIRFATRADALGIAEMSRDFIEHGLGWSWTRERILRSLRHRDTNAIVAVREADRAGFAHHEIRRRGGAPAAPRGQAFASTLRRRQRDGRLARALAPRSPASAASRSRRAPATRPRAPSIAVTATRRRSCCPATTAAARRACAWSRTSACRERERCDPSLARRCRRRRCAVLRCRRGRRPGDGRDRSQAVAARLPSACRRAPTNAPSGAASSASLARSRATTRAPSSRILHAGTVFDAGIDRCRPRPRRGDQELGRDRRRQDDRLALASGHRPDRRRGEHRASRAGPTSCIACATAPLSTASACTRPIWVRDAREGVWRVLFDGSATTGQPVDDRAAADRWVEDQPMSDCAA